MPALEQPHRFIICLLPSLRALPQDFPSSPPGNMEWGEEKNLAKTLSCHTVLLGTVFLLLSLAGILFTDKLLLILDTPETIFSSAEEYLKILFTGIPFLAVYNTYSAILRGMGNSKAPFLSVLVSSGVNVGLDLVLSPDWAMVLPAQPSLR